MTLKNSTEIMSRREFPTYNHTRSDGFYNPCPECAKLMTPEELETVRSDKLRPKYTTLELNPAARALLVEILTGYVENVREVVDDDGHIDSDIAKWSENLAWAEAVVDKLNAQIISDCENKE